MIQERNLEEEMRRFFDKLPEHVIHDNYEQVELTWSERGYGREWRTRPVSNLDHAARMAVALGPDRDVSILVRERPDGVARAVGRFELLAVWRYRERRPDDLYPISDLDEVNLGYSEAARNSLLLAAAFLAFAVVFAVFAFGQVSPLALSPAALVALVLAPDAARRSALLRLTAVCTGALYVVGLAASLARAF